MITSFVFFYFLYPIVSTFLIYYFGKLMIKILKYYHDDAEKSIGLPRSFMVLFSIFLFSIVVLLVAFVGDQARQNAPKLPTIVKIQWALPER